MKIIYITHSLPIGGAESLVVNYLLKLKNRGEDVSLIEIYHEDSFLSERIKDSGIPYYTLLNRNIFERIIYRLCSSLFVNRLNRFIRDINPDIIHYHTVYRFMERVAFPVDKCFFTFHARVDRCFNIGAYVKPLFERLSQNGLNFIAISSKVEDDIHKNLPKANVVNIPNGIDLSDIRTHRRSKEDVRRELGIDEDTFVVGQVGRFNKVKNHLFTIEVFRVIAHRNKKALLIFIGDGNIQEKEIITNRINEYGIGANVKLLGLRDDAIQLMCGLDILIQPSFSESFSLTLIEAQANGVRCVASDEIPQEVVCNNNCYQLSLSEPVEKWADVLMNDTECEEKSDLNQFDIETVLTRHIDLYKSISNRH